MPVYSLPLVVQSAAVNDLTTVKCGCSLSDGNTHTEDIAKLGAAWYYNWSATPTNGLMTGFVPMSWAGEMINGLESYLDILFGNEFDNQDQANLPPEIAAQRYAAMWAKYGTRLIPAGVIWDANDWTGRFVAALHALGIPTPTRWHIHGYAEPGFTVDNCIAFWSRMYDRYPGDYWITEFGATDGDPGKMKAFLDWMNATSWIVRYAWFSNRVDYTKPWYPPQWPKPYPGDLVSADGTLTTLGQVYVENKT